MMIDLYAHLPQSWTAPDGIEFTAIRVDDERHYVRVEAVRDGKAYASRIPVAVIRDDEFKTVLDFLAFCERVVRGEYAIVWKYAREATA